SKKTYSMSEKEWWREKAEEVVIYAGTHPYEFIYYVLLCLSPFFFISALLSWQLAKQIEQKERAEKKQRRRDANIAKVKSKQKASADKAVASSEKAAKEKGSKAD
ncbi:unnamed protein product, partial [Owenia fusiformis]